MSTLVKTSVALFFAAEAFIFAAVGMASLPLVAGWAIAGLAVTGLWLLARGALARVAVSGLFLVACLLLVVEEGLFFVPCAAVLVLAATRGRHPRRTRHPRHAVRAGH